MTTLAVLAAEYVADLSDLESGTQKAIELVNSFSKTADGPVKVAASFALVTAKVVNFNAAAASATSATSALAAAESSEAAAAASAGAATAEAASSASSLAAAESEAAADASSAAAEMDSMAAATDRASSSASSMTGSLGSLVGKILEVGNNLHGTVSLVGDFIKGAIDLGTSLLGPAASMEQVQSSLEVFTGSTEKAQKEMANLAAFSAKTPFETRAIDDAAIKMQSVGISADKVIPNILALGDALDATSHTSAADLDHIVSTFNKIKTTGHLTTEVMQSFADAGIDAWGVLEKQTGKTHAQLADLISRGLYPANQAMNDLTTGIEANPLYKGQMANDADVLVGSISTLKSNWDQLMTSFGTPIVKTLEGGVNMLNQALNNPAVKQFAEGVGKKLGEILTKVGEEARKAGDFLKNTFGKPLADLKKAVEPLIKQFADWADKNNILGNAGNGVKDALAGIAGVIAGMLENLASFINWIQNGGLPAEILRDALFGIGFALAAINIVNFLLALPGLIAGFFAWAGAAWTAAAGVIAATWPLLLIIAIIALVVTAIVLAVNHWGEIAGWLQGVWSGVASFFTWLWGRIVAIFGGIGAWFHDRWMDAWNALSSVFGKVGGWFHDRWTDAVNAFKSVFGGLKDFAMGVWNGIVGGVKSAFNWVIDLINGVINNVNNIHIGDVGLHIPLIPHLAKGTDFASGGLTLVGERGPELVNMPRGAQVFPNDVTTSMLAPRSASVGASSISVSPTGPRGGGRGESQLGEQTIVLEFEGREMAKYVNDYQKRELRVKAVVRR